MPPTEIEQLKVQLAQRDRVIAERDHVIAQHQSTITALTKQRDEFHLEKLRLEVRLARLLKQVYGPRADRVGDAAQMLLDFARQLEAQPVAPEDLPPAEEADARVEDPGARPHSRRLRTRGRRDIGSLDHLPLIEKTYELTGELCRCPGCRDLREQIGTEVSYTIEHIPASFVRIRHIQCKYACRTCEQAGFNPNIERAAKAGASPIDKGMVGPGLLAHVATSKYADYLPLHRLEAIFAREGFELDRSTLCLWMADAARIVKPLYDRMAQRVKQSHVLATDDTEMPLLAPGKTRPARMWIYRGDDANPYNVFDFTESRRRDGPAQFLKDFRGTLLADAYGGYNGVVLNQELPRAGCWAHARRKFVEAEPAAREDARAILAPVNRLFKIETQLKDLDPDERQRRRQAEARPIVETLHTRLLQLKDSLLPKHPLALAIGYSLNQWKELTLFLTDGAVPIHNNLAEQEMKRIALLRKNALFVATPRGGETAAILSSLTSTCRRHAVNPQLYLTQLLANLPDSPSTRIDDWLPDRWKKHSPLCQK
ncbi:MAG: IS66 family transposase [Rubrivivax sp.]|nr:IS66 family transposase [Rubrivivax sp.]